MGKVLVINSGSSSLKYQLVDTGNGAKIAAGLVERIGLAGANIEHTQGGEKNRYERDIADHSAAFAAVTEVFAGHGLAFESLDLTAVGHRVVQGGEKFIEPTLINGEVELAISELAALAPLHNPGQLAGIRAARKVFPGVPHVAVFDTAFHQSMPPAAYEYAIDSEVARQHNIRRYGFHGTSHSYVSRRAAEFLGQPVEALNQVVLHLGKFAAAAAAGDERAIHALAVYTHRIKHYLGAYAFELGRLDTVIFTAGIGENVAHIRAAACAGLESFGILIDAGRNNSTDRAVREISTDNSRVRVLVVPTDEELEIAIQASRLVELL